MRDKIIRFLSGRYGVYTLGSDRLMKWSMGAALALLIIGTFLPFRIAAGILSLISLLIFGWQVFRFLSKNIVARQRENVRFEKILDNINIFFGGKTEGDNKIYFCPKCKKKVRVPKGRGKICITCPGCGRKFVKKT